MNTFIPEVYLLVKKFPLTSCSYECTHLQKHFPHWTQTTEKLLILTIDKNPHSKKNILMVENLGFIVLLVLKVN